MHIIFRRISRIINLIQYIVSNVINIYVKLFGYKLHTSQKRLVIYSTHIAADLIIIFIKLFITMSRSFMTSPRYVDTAFLFWFTYHKPWTTFGTNYLAAAPISVGILFLSAFIHTSSLQFSLCHIPHFTADYPLMMIFNIYFVLTFIYDLMMCKIIFRDILFLQ